MNPSTIEPSLRRGTPADAAALAAFAARTFAETFGPENRAADMEEHLRNAYGESLQRQELSDPAYVTLLMQAGGQLVAYAQLRRCDAPPCVTGEAPLEVRRFYVDTPWHGRGLAQRLMRAVHDTALTLGGRTLWLSVWERNARAIAFYSKCGYVDVGMTDFYVGSDRQTDRVLAMPVTGSSSAPR